MAYEEVSPRELSMGELETIHNFSVDAGIAVTTEVLMCSYSLRRNASHPPEESEGVKLHLTMYDQDWERLTEAGVLPPEENDPRVFMPNGSRLPAFTNIINARLFETRDVAKARWVERAEKELNKLQEHTKQEVVRAIGKVGLSRVNELLQLLGIGVDEQGEPTYEEVEEAQLEGVRRVARLMSPKHRDMVRMNPHIAYPADAEAVASTEIEEPELRKKYKDFLKSLGLEGQ